MRTSARLFSLLFLLSALFLSACGGGGGGEPGSPTPTPTPTSSLVGAIDNPVVVSYPSAFTYSNSVALDTFGKYFKITGLTPGQDYKLSLSTSKPLRINA